MQKIAMRNISLDNLFILGCYLMVNRNSLIIIIFIIVVVSIILQWRKFKIQQAFNSKNSITECGTYIKEVMYQYTSKQADKFYYEVLVDGKKIPSHFRIWSYQKNFKDYFKILPMSKICVTYSVEYKLDDDYIVTNIVVKN